MSDFIVSFSTEIYNCDCEGWVTDSPIPLYNKQVYGNSFIEVSSKPRHRQQRLLNTAPYFTPWRFKDWESRIMVRRIETNETAKQPRYQDAKGEDWIDECGRTLTPEEFRGAMMFTMGKYIRRMGKKDDVKQEVGKLADYANRWLQYESQLDDS
jgi:hypothetical protein